MGHAHIAEIIAFTILTANWKPLKMKKEKKNKTSLKRGAAFVLDLGTRVHKDKKKEENKFNCRKKED